MSIFDINNNVSDSSLPKRGKYRVNIVKCEQTQSKANAAMLKLELMIPASDPYMVEQKFNNPVKIYDFVVDSEADMCQRHKNQFLKATGVKDAAGLAALVGKSVEVIAKPKSDDFGDKMVVDKYIADSLGDAASSDIPF